MNDLDDLSVYERLDPSGLHRRLQGLPSQCRQAWQEAKQTEVPGHWRDCTEVIVAGMGGSAIAGDLVSDLAGPSASMPIRMVRDFRIPGILTGNKPGQLIVVCSFSGETDETLAMFDQARSAGLAMATITGAGTLARRAAEAAIPVMTVNAPGEPRSAVGYSLMLLASLLGRIGVLSVSDSEVDDAVNSAESMVSQVGIDVPTEDNQAKLLAKELVGRLVLVYGGGALSGMALRWKSQINENGKSWAFAELLPEVLHNSVESFPGSPEILQRTTALLLKPCHTTPELGRRYEVLRETLDRSGIENRMFTGVAGGLLAQSLSMIVLGDHVSYYMGLLNGINPAETPNIDFSKEQLST
jgi:glucose/mannose-6-phosphate isomerase|tara:strand:- start:967 stop:2034 length:1068 start_codon:yes stop_codon:yes gene_type:complete